jgi:inosine/xanthosine triphosphatase
MYRDVVHSNFWYNDTYMKINVGSKNQAKVRAVEELLQEYPHLKDAEIFSFEAVSGVSDQPKSLDESVQGAMNRAKKVFKDCAYSLGIESGLMVVPNTKSGFMDVCVCAIYNGEEFHIGLSSAWEAPKKVMKHMLESGLNMTQAAQKSGLTDNPNIGSAEGLIGIMTKGRLTRKEYTKEAIRTALIHLEQDTEI